MTSPRPTLIAALVVVLAACSSGGGSPGGTTGGGGSSGGTTGGGTTGTPDAGLDGGRADAGRDAGVADAGRDGGEDGGHCGQTGEYGLCIADSDCACPFVCNPDDPFFGFSGAPGSVCEHPCATTADCPEVLTSCQNGYCAYDLCDVNRTELGLPPNGRAGGPCDAADAGDGSCVVVPGEIAVCEQGGTSTTSCDPSATRASPASLCVPGSVCVAGVCRQGCDPSDGGACPAGQGCGALDPALTFLDFGACFPLGDAGCLAGLAGNELAPCSAAAGCACLAGADVACVADPGIGPTLNPYGGQSYCERACAGTADCALPTTVCAAGRCSDDFCGRVPGGADAGGAWDAPCDAAGQGDGTCLPVRTSLADPAYGLCLQGGSATAGCDPLAGRGDPGALCGAGSVCVLLADGGAGCLPACDPGVASPCASGQCVGSAAPGASGHLGSCQ